MSPFTYAGLFFALALAVVLLGFVIDQRFGRPGDFGIFVCAVLVFGVLLLCSVAALAWGALRAMGWLP